MLTQFSRVAKQTSKRLTALAAASVMAFSGLALAAPMFFSGSAAAATPGDILINEISPASATEWVELYNPSSTSVSVANWSVQFDATSTSQTSTLSGSIPGHGYMVVTTGGNTWLANSGDTVILKDDSATTINTVTYSTTIASNKSYARTTNGGSTWSSAATPTQGKSNDPTNELSVCAGGGCDYMTIASAVSAASADSTIYVGAEIYSESVTINKALTLEGARAGVAAANNLTGVERSGSESSVTSFDVTTSNVVIDGFTISGIRVDGPSTGILSGLDIENNIFSGYSDVALPTYDAGGIAIQQNYFTNPVGSSEAMQIKADSFAGGCSNTQVLNNVFDAATNNGGADINFSCTGSHSSSVAVTGNYSTGNTGGSSLTAFSGVDGDITISDNIATTSGSTVFFFGNVGSSSAYISGNTFTNGGGNGVSIYGGDAGTTDTPNTGTFTITNNNLSGNNLSAIKLSSNALTGAGKVVANNNDFSGSTSGVAVNNLSSGPVDVNNNYWGANPNFATLISGSNVTYTTYYVNSARTHLNTDTVSTVYVDPSYNSSSAGGHEYGWDAFSTIQGGVNALTNGGTVYVDGGPAYNENVTLNAGVNLVGASKTTTFINGMVTVNAAGSSVSGFDITNPSGDFGVLINHVGNVSVTGNNIHDVSQIGANDYGVYFQSSGSTDVSSITISDNTISNIGSASDAKSSGAIGIGDSSAHMNITSGLDISNNVISNINSSTKGAYGILLNLGSSSTHAVDTASISGASITGNTISGLTGGWEHAIGLETNTPNATVTGNTISGLASAGDVAAVHFEKNPGANTVTLTGSTLDGKSLSNSNANVTVDSSAPVVSSSSELNTYPEYLVGDTYEYAGLNVFNTIQSAVDGVASGGTVTVPAGNFNENVTLNKALTLEGAGSSIVGTVIQPASGNAVTVAASGSSSANPLTIEGLRLSSASGNGVYFNSTASHVKLSDVETINSVYGIEIHNSAVLNDLVLDNVGASNNQIGFRVATTGSVNGLTITNSSFDYNTSEGMYITASSSKTTNQNDFTNISISDTSFSNDGNKGIYAEKLDHATFTNVTVDNSGTSGSSASGFNINEKYGSYQNITINNSTVTNSGTGDSTNGTGYDIEARNDGSYASNPATLNGVTISGGTVSGNQVGLRFGETGKNNAGPTNASIKKVDLSGNIGLAVNNQTQASVDASQNYWGSASPDFSSLVSGTVTDSPWYTDQAMTKLASSSNVSTTSSSTGTTSLPSGSTGVALDSSTKLDLSSGLSGASGGNLTVGGTTQSLGSYSSGNISGQNLNNVNVSGITVSVGQAVQLQSGSSGQPITITNASLNNVTVSVPDSTTILAPSGWDGTIAPPKTVSATGTAPSGFSVGSTVIEVGSPGNVLLFDKPVMVELDGVTGQVGYKPAGTNTWTLIPACSNTGYNIAQDPGFPGVCSVTDGTNTKIWTYHFTEFANMNTVSSSNSGSGSSSSSSNSSGSKVVTTSSSSSTGSNNGSGAGAVQGQSTNANSGKTSSTSTNKPAAASLPEPKVAAKEAVSGGLRWYWMVLIAIAAVSLAALVAYRLAEGTDKSS